MATCKNKMKELTAKTPEGFTYNYYKCSSCGDEVLNMKQLHAIAEKYRKMKRCTKLHKRFLESRENLNKKAYTRKDLGI